MSLLTLMLVGAFAADHADGGVAAADPAADIADLFTWNNGTQLYTVLTFAGLGLPGETGVYDADVLYGIHIDTDGDATTAETDIWVRFGQDSLGAWGVQVSGMPGTGAPVVGAVETVINAPGGRVFAGVRDDPFYFDLVGFNDTVASLDGTQDGGSILFTGADALAGTNVTSIVLEMDEASASDGATNLNIWATSHRL